MASLVILTDTKASWRPDCYCYELWGCKAGLRFPSVKLLDYKERWNELEESNNPFASVVMAHLKTIETTWNNNQRYQWKLSLIKRLYRRGYDKENVIRLFDFIDWIMALPKEMEQKLWMEINKMEKHFKKSWNRRLND